MTKQDGDQLVVEGVQYTTNAEAPGAPDKLTYYPSKLSPEADKRATRGKILGSVVATIGLVLSVFGVIFAIEYHGALLITVVVVAVLSFIFSVIFALNANLTLGKLARTLPLIGYIALLILIVSRFISAVTSIQVSGPDLGPIMDSIFGGLPGLGDFLIFIGLLCLRGGAGMLRDAHGVRTDISPSIIVLGGPGVAPEPQQIPPTEIPPKPVHPPKTGRRGKKKEEVPPPPEEKAEKEPQKEEELEEEEEGKEQESEEEEGKEEPEPEKEDEEEESAEEKAEGEEKRKKGKKKGRRKKKNGLSHPPPPPPPE